ncbi:MAG TPA: IS3 family transposase [Flavobacterium sp.]|nr:IS3 family transposase [Flavobacterium sp.]
MLIEPEHPLLSVEAQCEALGLPRSSYYYAPIKESDDTLMLMKRIEEMHYSNPEYGYRKIHVELRREGFQVNEKKIERLWYKLGFLSNLPRKSLSKPSIERMHYPYLLNGLWIGTPNQVFSADITFLPLARGFVYLVTVTDWFSRYVLARELSNTMTADFCIIALEKALLKARPEYFNTDQGSQFTSAVFLERLQQQGIKISMDGKGRCIDNVYQERGWWSLKYEKIYQYRYETVKELRAGVDEYFEHFNHRRPHQALLYATPNEIYHGLSPKYSKGRYRGFEVKKAKGNPSRGRKSPKGGTNEIIVVNIERANEL